MHLNIPSNFLLLFGNLAKPQKVLERNTKKKKKTERKIIITREKLNYIYTCKRTEQKRSHVKEQNRENEKQKSYLKS